MNGDHWKLQYSQDSDAGSLHRNENEMEDQMHDEHPSNNMRHDLTGDYKMHQDFSSSKKADDPKYMDWASNILLDQGNDLIGGFDFSESIPTSNNNIMQKIQYQSNVHDQELGSEHLLSAGKDVMPAKTAPMKIEQRTKQRRPCDHCRRRKTKCVIIPGTTNCAQCETKSLTCTFSQPTTKEQDESAKRARKSAPSPTYNATGYVGPTNEIIPPSVAIRDVAPVHDYSVMNNSLLKKTLSLQFPRSSFYVGPTSYLFDSNLLEVIIGAQNKDQSSNESGSSRGNAVSKIEQVNLSSSISLRKVGTNTQFVLKDDQSKQSYQNMSDDVDAIEKFVAPHGQILIDLYFRIIHPSYPILHKKVFLEKYSRTHREFSAPLLAAVYALAIQWWDYDPQLNRFPKPNVAHILKIALNNYLLEILKRPKLSAVQAGLLLLQCKHILRKFGASGTGGVETPAMLASESLNSSFNDSDYNDWVLCSQVVALAEELGLGLDCDGWKLPKWERGLRKRLAWAVYMEDKWLSLKNARPSHINDMNWVVLHLVEEDFPEKHGDGDLKEGSSDITNGKKNFMNLISLSRNLSEILNSLFSMQAMKEVNDINEVLRIAKPIQLKLRTWYHSLPIELQMNSVQPRKLCSNGYLQLAYFATELTLHRKIITILHQHDYGSIASELVNVCRTAAKTRLLASIDFVKDLKPEHIHSFWHSSATSNFTLIGTFAALLFISSPDKQEADYFKEQIFNYRWILKISSKGFVQVGDALQKLDLVLNHIPGLLNESADQPMVVPNVPTIDYNKFYQQQQQLQQPQQSLSQQLKTHSEQGAQPSIQRYNTAAQNSQFMGMDNRSPGTYGVNGKMKEMSRPGSSQQYRMQPVNSPLDSSQGSQTPLYFAQQSTGGSSRASHIGMNSPQSSQGLSPKELTRQQKSGLSNTTPQGGRRPSTTSHHSESLTNPDNHSSKGNSPVLMRSPLAHQQTINSGNDEG